MKNKINKLSTFERVQLMVMTFVGSTLLMTVINWGLNGFTSTFGF